MSQYVDKNLEQFTVAMEEIKLTACDFYRTLLEHADSGKPYEKTLIPANIQDLVKTEISDTPVASVALHEWLDTFSKFSSQFTEGHIEDAVKKYQAFMASYDVAPVNVEKELLDQAVHLMGVSNAMKLISDMLLHAMVYVNMDIKAGDK